MYFAVDEVDGQFQPRRERAFLGGPVATLHEAKAVCQEHSTLPLSWFTVSRSRHIGVPRFT